jgi:serine protease
LKRSTGMRRGLSSALIVVTCLVLASGAAVAQGGGQGPPFRAGEVAVFAAPEELAGFEVVKHLPRSGISVVRVDSGREWGQVQSFRIKGHRAGLNFIAEAFATVDDPLYPGYQWHLPAIQSEAAWDLTPGAGVIVAVNDSGLNPLGIDGINCVEPGYDFVNMDSDPFDGDGHGTHVSGTVAQASNNGVGVAGMAHGACVMPVKVLNDTGSGSFADIAEGIFFAVDNGASVINMSLGIAARYRVYNDPIVDPALDYAYDNGVTVVCASGNDGSRRNVGYPASYVTTIAVGATDYANEVTSYSNKGTGLDIVAPGGDLGADLNGDGYGDGVLQETDLNDGEGFKYYFFDGTSMASPHVAAVAAMLYAYGTATTPDEVYEALTQTALDIEDHGFDSASAWGLVQAFDALNYGSGVVCVDGDGDGYDANCGAIDCDDGDDGIYPGAAEVCDDGVDNNCDGAVDEGCGGTCTDADGDGWCVEDGDCDDTNPNVYPGHTDTRGRWKKDGLDNDCNGIIDG